MVPELSLHLQETVGYYGRIRAERAVTAKAKQTKTCKQPQPARANLVSANSLKSCKGEKFGKLWEERMPVLASAVLPPSGHNGV